MAESGCLRDAHFQNLQVSGKPFFSRANDVTQVSAGSTVTSNGASGTIVLADKVFDTRANGGTSNPANHFFTLENNHINKESNIFFTLDLTENRATNKFATLNNAFFVSINQTRSLQADVRIAAVGNGRQNQSIGKLKYLVIN